MPLLGHPDRGRSCCHAHGHDELAVLPRARCSLMKSAGLVVCLAAFSTALAADQHKPETNEWHGKLSDGTIISSNDLMRIVEQHENWVVSSGTNGTQAVWPHAELTNATLRVVNLSFADFFGANLRDAILSGADLRHVNFEKANLANADLYKANLSDANLTEANLSGAVLAEATLSNAVLIRADLSGADLREADVSHVILELKPGTLPNISFIASARNLSQMIYLSSPQALMELRGAFANAGLHEQEREVNYAIMHTRRIKAGLPEKALLWAVEIPCKYGMERWRPLKILFVLILVFWVPYVFGLRKHGKSGIWIIWPKDRAPKDPSREQDARLNPPGVFGKLGTAFYFSILSAFNIGWKEINVGTWIARIQPKEFTLKATGWIRVLAGLQSLISVYMIALWVLSYFGHLFE